MVKNPPANTGNTKDMSSIPGWRRPPGERNDNPLQFLPGEFQEQRSLAGNSPWSRKESNTTEQLCTSHSTALFIEYLVCAKYLIHTANQSIGLLLGRCKGSWVWQFLRLWKLRVPESWSGQDVGEGKVPQRLYRPQDMDLERSCFRFLLHLFLDVYLEQ